MNKTILAVIIAFAPLSAGPTKAATIIGTEPFLQTAKFQCPADTSNARCQATFPLVVTDTQLVIKFVSCSLEAAPPLTLGRAFLGRDNANPPPHLPLPWVTREGTSGRPIGEVYVQTQLTVDAGHRPQIGITIQAPHGVTGAECTIAGDLLTL